MTTDELFDALLAARGDRVLASELAQRLAVALKGEASRGVGVVERNRDGVADADLRRDVDPVFEALHDGLEAAYYGAWRHGRSQPWQGYDVQPTPALSKQLFDDLHGLIFHHREMALDAADERRPIAERVPDRRRRGPDGRTKADAARDAVDALAIRGLTITT